MKAEHEPTPDQLLIDGIIATFPARAERRSVAFNFTGLQNTILLEAARERNLSLSSYVRRAALAFAAYDLGLTLEQVLSDETRMKDASGEWTAPDTHGNWRLGQVTP